MLSSSNCHSFKIIPQVFGLRCLIFFLFNQTNLGANLDCNQDQSIRSHIDSCMILQYCKKMVIKVQKFKENKAYRFGRVNALCFINDTRHAKLTEETCRSIEAGRTCTAIGPRSIHASRIVITWVFYTLIYI